MFTDPKLPDDSDLYRAGFYAAGFWGPRGEDPEASADRLQGFLQKLASINPLLTHWYFPESRMGDGRNPAPNSASEWTDIVKRKIASLRLGITEHSASGLGAVIRIWSGDPGNSAGLSLRVGHISPRIGNAVVLNLPPTLSPIFVDLERSRSVIDAIVSSWDPDRAVMRPADVPRADAPPLKPGDVVRVEDHMHQFPDWISYKRKAPLVLGGPFASAIPTAQPSGPTID